MKTTKFLSILIASLFLCPAFLNGQALSIDNNNDVGIGESNPVKRLHVEDNTDEVQLLLENNISSGGHGVSGAGIQLENGNNYGYYLMNESANGWGHTNTFDIRTNDGYIPFQIYPDHHINLNNYVSIDYQIKVHHGEKASYRGASGFDFNPYKSDGGMILEQKYSEGSGFYADGDYAVIWSPGDYNRLLRVYDEDGMNEKWYINGSGYDYHNSDGRKKENIRGIHDGITKLKKVHGVKYNFKMEEDVEPKGHVSQHSLKAGTVKGDSIWPGDRNKVDNNKYDPSGKEYYGFVAQDIQKIFPEMVDSDEKGNLFICYTQFIPVLVEAYKAQQNEMEEKQEQIEDLNKRLEHLEKVVGKLGSRPVISRKQ